MKRANLLTLLISLIGACSCVMLRALMFQDEGDPDGIQLAANIPGGA